MAARDQWWVHRSQAGRRRQEGVRIIADVRGLPPGKHMDGALQMPSFGSSGLRIDLRGGKLDVGAGQTIVLINFDVKESFGPKPETRASS